MALLKIVLFPVVESIYTLTRTDALLNIKCNFGLHLLYFYRRFYFQHL